MGELSDDELRKTQLDDIVTLAEAAADDGFGTEQQRDPRGDGREGDVPEISSMADLRAVVEYIKNELSTLEMFDSDVLAGIIAGIIADAQSGDR